MARDAITWDSTQLDRFASDLKRFAIEAMPFATREGINNGAKMLRGLARQNIERKMITRNRFTVRGVGIEFAKQKAIRQQRAVVGHFQQYMADQEFSATKQGKGKHGVILPTRFSSGEGEGTAPRQKLPKFGRSVRGIRLNKSANVRKAKNRGVRNQIAVREAAASGRNKIFMKTDRVTGYFQIKGGKRKPQPKLLADLSRKTVTISAKPWLFPAARVVEKALPQLYLASIKKQLTRRRLFAGKR